MFKKWIIDTKNYKTVTITVILLSEDNHMQITQNSFLLANSSLF